MMRIRVMTEDDIPGGLRLNTVCGWNQTGADWLRFLRQSPQGCFVMESDANIVGTATTISYEDRFAWIGMVLVDPDFRNKGIGTQLLHKTIEYLDHFNIPTMKLDATPLGKPLYAKLGFVTEYEVERWILKRAISPTLTTRNNLNQIAPTQLAEILELDKKIFGADRSFLLRSLQEQSPEFAAASWSNGAPQAYSFGRHGLFADHLGPWMASSSTTAEEVLKNFLVRSTRDKLIVDCMKANVMAVDLLTQHGFSVARPLTRMVRGPNTYPGMPGSLCAILGPEFG
ncbi:MAG TPA: GNAT family N-acetyltransferase [Candidatus Acidoferrum sp.]|nr:GNAT family N-acetyltransferase [Candidatus Acidoferrum sp.]